MYEPSTCINFSNYILVVTFQLGDTQQFVTFTSNNDTTVEGIEMMAAVPSNRSAGASLGQQNTATISIVDVVGSECYQHCCVDDHVSWY